MVKFSGEKEDKKTKIKLSESARTTINPITRIPKKVVQINRFPSPLKEGTIPISKDNAAVVLQSFLKENQEFFGINPEDLRVIKIKKVRGKWYVKFQQGTNLFNSN